MDYTLAVILGLVQGIAEWLPVSSEGLNSLILTTFYNQSLGDAAYLSVWLHTGTLLAAIIYFRKTLWQLIKNLKHYSFNQTKPNQKNNYTNFLIVSTIATGILGLPILLFGLDKLNFQGRIATALIGLLLIITGLIQLYVKKQSLKKLPSTLDATLIGIVQSFAGLPGLSRSGLTVSALLFRGYDAHTALSLSFLMSIPVVFGAELVLGLTDKIIFTLPIFVAMLISFFTGLLSIKILMKIADKLNFGYFCIFLGILSTIPYLFW